MSCITPDEYTQVVRKQDVVDFCARCVEKVGISHEHSRELGEVLVAGDYRGHYSHGINRLGMLVVQIVTEFSNVCQGCRIESLR